MGNNDAIEKYSEDVEVSDENNAPELEIFYLAFLRKGPTWSPEVTPEVEEGQRKHLAHLAKLGEEGKLLLAGPVSGGSDDLRGLSVLKAESLEEAQSWCDADPAVQSGRLQIDVITWYMPKGRLQVGGNN